MRLPLSRRNITTVKQCLYFFYEAITNRDFSEAIVVEENFSVGLSFYYFAAYYVLLLLPTSDMHDFLAGVREYPILFSTVCCMVNYQNLPLLVRDQNFPRIFNNHINGDYLSTVETKCATIRRFVQLKIAGKPDL